MKLLSVLLLPVVLMLTSTMSHAHSGHLNEKAIEVCVEQSRSDSCQYEGGHNDLYKGTCQYMSTTLMCVRNEPIQKMEPVEGEDHHSHEVENKGIL